MRILIDILHPAHVHVFRHFRAEMLSRGHEVVVTSRAKDVTIELLDAYEIPHTVLSSQGEGRLALAGELALRSARLVRVARRFSPDVMIGIMGPAIALAGRLLRIPSIVMYDTEFAPSNRWVFPLATVVVTPAAFSSAVRGNHVTYPGFHELAYLHPNRFTPDRRVLDELGIQRPYSLVRFVSWTASHDIGRDGLSLAQKRAIVDRLLNHGKVYITSEAHLPTDLEPRRVRVPVELIHDVMAFAQVVIGESPTMSSEAGILGAPSVLISPFSAGVLEAQEAEGLIVQYKPDQFDALLNMLDHVHNNDKERRWAERLDLTCWLVHMVETGSWA